MSLNVVALQQPKTLTQLGVPQYNPQMLSYQADFGAAQTYLFDFTLIQAAQTFGRPISIYCNNSSNPNQLQINISGTQENIIVPAFSVGMLPIAASANDKISITSVGGASSFVEIEFFNYMLPPYVYQGLAPFVPGSQVEALVQSASSLINRNTLLGAAVATNVFPTVAATRMCRFRNVGDGAGGGDNAFWQVGVTATGVFSNGDTVLQPGETIVMPYRTAQRISFFSTLGTRIEAVEWSD